MCLSVYVSLSLPMCLSIYVSFSLPMCLFVYVYATLSLALSLSLSLPICLSASSLFPFDLLNYLEFSLVNQIPFQSPHYNAKKTN
jgi:hypothetical protein